MICTDVQKVAFECYLAESLARYEGLHLDSDLLDAIEGVAQAIWTFEWQGREDANLELGEDNGVPTLNLVVWVDDSDDSDEDFSVHRLTAASPIARYEDPKEQIRSLIHWHLCHEVDERLVFNYEKPFYPIHTPHPTQPGVSYVEPVQ